MVRSPDASATNCSIRNALALAEVLTVGLIPLANTFTDSNRVREVVSELPDAPTTEAEALVIKPGRICEPLSLATSLDACALELLV